MANNAEPIDLARLALRTLRALDDGRRMVRDQWGKLVAQFDPDPTAPSADRRQPPDIW